jgi:hypothetical protein
MLLRHRWQRFRYERERRKRIIRQEWGGNLESLLLICPYLKTLDLTKVRSAHLQKVNIRTRWKNIDNLITTLNRYAQSISHGEDVSPITNLHMYALQIPMEDFLLTIDNIPLTAEIAMGVFVEAFERFNETFQRVLVSTTDINTTLAPYYKRHTTDLLLSAHAFAEAIVTLARTEP